MRLDLGYLSSQIFRFKDKPAYSSHYHLLCTVFGIAPWLLGNFVGAQKWIPVILPPVISINFLEESNQGLIAHESYLPTTVSLN